MLATSPLRKRSRRSLGAEVSVRPECRRDPVRLPHFTALVDDASQVLQYDRPTEVLAFLPS